MLDVQFAVKPAKEQPIGTSNLLLHSSSHQQTKIWEMVWLMELLPNLESTYQVLWIETRSG